MKFSERIGKNTIKEIIQLEDIDEELKNALWNAVTFFYWDIIKEPYINSNRTPIQTLLTRIWIFFFKKRYDEMPTYVPEFRQFVKDFFFKAEWFEIYDFVEFLSNNYDDDEHNTDFMNYCNRILKKELSGFRFIDNIITSLTNEEEISSISESLKNTNSLKTVNLHIIRAIELFSDRKAPDYRNSIKESISAVEAYCAIITHDSKATLGQTLKQIEDKTKIHPALKKAFSNLYGYTSEANGIRHALLEEEFLEQEDAKFMLVSCSAFINYLIDKSNKI